MTGRERRQHDWRDRLRESARQAEEARIAHQRLVRAAWEDGLSLRTIAPMLHVSYRTVSRMIGDAKEVA